MKTLVQLALASIFILAISGLTTDKTKAVKSGIALTYANDKLMDGAGAQLQRVYGIYAVARYLHLPYVHTPLKKIGYQGLVALEKNTISPNMQDKWNKVFTIPSDIELPENTISRYVDTPKVEDLERLKREAQEANQFYLVKILLPYPITDKDPEIYHCLKDISPFKSTRSNTFRIAIHVRRGEEFVYESKRMLPNSYYLSATMKVVAELKKLGIPFVCELYTEVSSKAFVVTPQTHGIEGLIEKPAVIDPAMNRIEDFDALPNLHKYINTDPIETMRGMATADALIISRSSFSYFAALFNKGMVIYFPFWHQPLKGWLTSDISGDIPSQEIVEQLKSWKRDHPESTGRIHRPNP